METIFTDFEYEINEWYLGWGNLFYPKNIPIELFKRYVYLHQFSKFNNIGDKQILEIIENFLDYGEEVFLNENEIILLLTINNDLNNVLLFLEFIFKILSFKVKLIYTKEYENLKIIKIEIIHYADGVNRKGFRK